VEEKWSLKSRRCSFSIGLGKGYRVSPIREVWVLLPTRVIRIGVWVLVQPRLEVVHICSMLNWGRGKMDSLLGNFQSHDLGYHIYQTKGKGHMNSLH